MKKLTIIAALAMATAAFAVPSTASAIWTDNGAHIEAGTPQIHGEGEVGFASPNGATSTAHKLQRQFNSQVGKQQGT
jgi:hypothetical protein